MIFSPFLESESIFQTVLFLLIKFTFVLGIVLLAYRVSTRKTPSFRHSILASGVLLTPLIVVAHFLIPAWSLQVPTTGFVQSVSGYESTTSETDAKVPSNETQSILANPADELYEVFECNISNATKASDVIPPFEKSEYHLANAPSRKCETDSQSLIVVPATAPKQPWNLVSVLFCVWLAGAIVMLFRLGVAHIVIRTRVANSKVIAPEAMLQSGVPEKLIESLASSRINVCIANKAAQMPMGSGVIRKTILLPTNCLEWNRIEWQAVLSHEIAHFKRSDCCLNFLARIQQAILWFHPLASMLVRHLGRESEHACDEHVLASGVSRFEYAEILLQFSRNNRLSQSYSLAAVSICDSSPLRNRVQNILGNSSRRIASPVAIASMILVSAILFIPIATAQLTQGNQQESEESAPKPKHNPGQSSWLDHFQEHNTPDYSDDDLLFNVSLQPNKGDVSYSGEFTGVADDPIELELNDKTLTVEIQDIESIYKKKRDANHWTIETTEGEYLAGKIINESMFFSVDRNFGGDESMSQTISPNDIYLMKRIRAVDLAAGQITNGVSHSKLSYFLRAPKSHKPESRWPALVLLHNNGENSKTYIQRIISKFPKLAERFVLVGINGERPRSDNKWNEDNSGFSYSGLSYCGKGSAYGALPGTDRESPAPIAESITELKYRLDLTSVFLVGFGNRGYSSGANNAFQIHCWFPEVVDGIVAINGASLIQSNVGEIHDAALQQRQRQTPIAVLASSQSSLDGHFKWLTTQYMDNSFPMIRIEKSDGSGLENMPFLESIEWLERLNEPSPEKAKQFANKLASEGRLRDAFAVISRLCPDDRVEFESVSLPNEVTEVAKARIKAFQQNILQKDPGSEWIDEFLEFRKTWEFALIAQTCMNSFNDLRVRQNEDASILFRRAERMKHSTDPKDKAGAVFAYQQIMETLPASKFYSRAKTRYKSAQKNQNSAQNSAQNSE